MNIKTVLHSLILVVGIFFSTICMAAWKLIPAKSSVNFISVKNETISEVNKFEELSGTIDNNGKVELIIPLKNIQTNIDLRNERIKNILFDLEKYPNAIVTATIVPKQIKGLKAGENFSMSLIVNVNFRGLEVPFPVKAEIVKLNNNNLQVTTTQPVMANTELFNLQEGVEMLRSLAGLKEISLMVPVGFKLVFRPDKV